MALQTAVDGVVSSLPLFELYVDDTGPGIPEEKREDVFESGYTTNRDGTGSGSIVTQIVEAHGWGIGLAESAEGGARFEITGVSVVDGDTASDAAGEADAAADEADTAAGND